MLRLGLGRFPQSHSKLLSKTRESMLSLLGIFEYNNDLEETINTYWRKRRRGLSIIMKNIESKQPTERNKRKNR